jgi:hypothetical protein
VEDVPQETAATARAPIKTILDVRDIDTSLLRLVTGVRAAIRRSRLLKRYRPNLYVSPAVNSP